ncbi:MAG TPA: hypothetical protein VKR27_02025 [Acidimicrobiales bacterium]|nr:hypothetical protein [Acidimicrobiales bacterium]
MNTHTRMKLSAIVIVLAMVSAPLLAGVSGAATTTQSEKAYVSSQIPGLRWTSCAVGFCASNRTWNVSVGPRGLSLKWLDAPYSEAAIEKDVHELVNVVWHYGTLVLASWTLDRLAGPGKLGTEVRRLGDSWIERTTLDATGYAVELIRV